jgi:hypothetical protein
MLYRVEVVQTNVFFIEADTPELAQNIAIEERIWDHNQTGRDAPWGVGCQGKVFARGS